MQDTPLGRLKMKQTNTGEVFGTVLYYKYTSDHCVIFIGLFAEIVCFGRRVWNFGCVLPYQSSTYNSVGMPPIPENLKNAIVTNMTSHGSHFRIWISQFSRVSSTFKFYVLNVGKGVVQLEF